MFHMTDIGINQFNRHYTYHGFSPTFVYVRTPYQWWGFVGKTHLLTFCTGGFKMLLDAFLDNHSESPECLARDMAKIYRCLKLFFDADKRDISIKMSH